jgi:hypothetical protein
VEGDVQGDFSPLANVISQVRQILAGSNKKYMVSLQDRSFGSSTASITAGGFPTYAINNGYCLVAKNPTAGTTTSLNFFSSAAIARFAEIGRQVALLCDADPQFGGYVAMDETSWPIQDEWHTQSPTGPLVGTPAQTYVNAVQTLITTVAGYFKQNFVRLKTNFIPTSNNAFWAQLFANLLPLNNVAFGGPDPAIASPTDFTGAAKFWQGLTDGHDYRPERLWIGEVQENGLGIPSLAGHTTVQNALAQIFQSQIGGLPGNTNASNHGRIMVWNYETYETVTATDIFAWIAANPTTAFVSPNPPSIGTWNKTP